MAVQHDPAGCKLTRRDGTQTDMSDTITTTTPVMPSATPSEDEIAAWEALPRDEQMRRMRALLSSEEASTATDSTMAEILAEARRRADVRERG